VAQPTSEEPAQVVDLMAALEASLAAARANKEKEAEGSGS
jgi:non-homologous end joining protein Ku